MNHTTSHTALTTSGRTRRAQRSRAGRRVTAVLAPMSLLLAAGCGAGPSAQEAPAQVAQAASAADLEREAVDSAEQSQLGWIEKAYGSDRHFGVITDRVADARVRATEGSDRHLVVIADQIADARVAAAEGSDRHLGMLAAELAAASEGE